MAFCYYAEVKRDDNGELFIERVINPELAPVVHSYWIEDGDDYICANCNEIVFPCVSGLQMDKSLKEGKTYWNYCPHCGAKMDGKEGKE